MKAQYDLQLDNDMDSILNDIADYFNTSIKTLEDDITKIISVPSRIRILQRKEENKYVLKVRGASNEDISFLSGILGEPIKIGQEKLSLNDFVKEVMNIPDVESKTKNEIIEILDIEENEFQQYYKQMERFVQRGRGPQAILDAYNILSK